MNPVDPRLEAYPDRLTRPLERTLNLAAVEEVRMDALFHIESLVRRERAGGSGEVEATRAALAEYGPAEAAEEEMLDERCRGRQTGTLALVASSPSWRSSLPRSGPPEWVRLVEKVRLNGGKERKRCWVLRVINWKTSTPVLLLDLRLQRRKRLVEIRD